MTENITQCPFNEMGGQSLNTNVIDLRWYTPDVVLKVTGCLKGPMGSCVPHVGSCWVLCPPCGGPGCVRPPDRQRAGRVQRYRYR